jgi:hypothetical protein
LGLKLVNLLSQSLLELSPLFGEPPLIFIELGVKVFERLPAYVCGFHDFIVSSEALKLKQTHDILETAVNFMPNYAHLFTLDLLDILCQGHKLSCRGNTLGN